MSTATLQQLIEPRAPEQRTARLILCEQHNDWAIALVRTDQRMRPLLCETRSPRLMWEALDISPRSLLGIELTTTNFEVVLDTLINLPRNHPQAVAVILTNRHLKGYEWILREAGAIDFLVSTRQLPSLVEMTLLHVNLTLSCSAAPVQNIWQRLPWRPHRETTEPANPDNAKC